MAFDVGTDRRSVRRVQTRIRGFVKIQHEAGHHRDRDAAVKISGLEKNYMKEPCVRAREC